MRHSDTTSARVMSTEGRSPAGWNARPTAAAAAACATTSRVTRRTELVCGAGRAAVRRLRGQARLGRLPGSDALTAHLRAGQRPAGQGRRPVPPANNTYERNARRRRVQSGPRGAAGLPRQRSVGSVAAAQRVPQRAAFCDRRLRSACSGGSAPRLDAVTGHRAPRQDTSSSGGDDDQRTGHRGPSRHECRRHRDVAHGGDPRGAAPPPGTEPRPKPLEWRRPPWRTREALGGAGHPGPRRARPRRPACRHTTTAMTAPNAAISSPAEAAAGQPPGGDDRRQAGQRGQGQRARPAGPDPGR